MISDLSFYFILVYATLGILLFIGVLASFVKEKDYISNIRKKDSIDLQDVTIIIPFRNERDRILPLLKAINDSSRLPKQLIFIDDHSSDGTAYFIKSELNIEHFLILNARNEGKKKAIEQGVEKADTNYILTFDADIHFNKNYFSSLSQLSKRDLLILPVKMKGRGWKMLFETDVDLANSINTVVAGYGSPILASGANLFFSKDAYLKYNQLESHGHIKSGDDVFLLNNFKKNNCSIQLITNSTNAVTTSTPENFKEFFGQRLRWIKKTPMVKNKTTTIIAILQFVINMLFYALLVSSLIMVDSKVFNFLLFGKFAIDFTSTAPYFYRIGKRNAILAIGLHQFWFPLESILLAVGMLFYKPIWKGRK